MILPHPNRLIRNIYHDALWKVKTNRKEIFITFDDGPVTGVTEKVLKLLQQYDAKATFFCTGNKIESSPRSFESISENGHSIGNHSFSHLKGKKTKNKDYFSDINKSDTLIKSKLFRPPYGSIRLSQYNYLKEKYKIVFWDVLTYDFHANVNIDKCFQIIKKYTRPGSILVFHDTEKTSETMLPALKKTLGYFTKEGYVFSKI